jgi:hypothetical protein
VVVKTTPGQPRYYDNEGNALAEVTVTELGAWDAGIQEDAGTGFTDYTTELNDAAASDVDFFPGSPAVNDAFYFGLQTSFEKITLNVGTAGTGVYTVAWQYWNGSTWTALSSLVDNTSNFKVAGTNTVTFDVPTDWATTTINGQGPFYYVRAIKDAGAVVVDPAGTQGWAAVHVMAPISSVEPNFFGASYTGSIAVIWESDTGVGVIDVEVWGRIDDSITVTKSNPNSPDDIDFTGTYVLLDSVNSLAHLTEIQFDVGYRPVFVRGLNQTSDGTLRAGPV